MIRAWRLQFGLRSLLAVLLLAGLLLGAWHMFIETPRAQEQQRIAAMRREGADVETATRGPQWFQAIFGEYYSQRVVSVMRGEGPQDAELLRLATQCRWLEGLALVNCGQLSSSEIDAVGGLKHLRTLNLSRANIPTDSLEFLAELGEFEELELYDVKVGDDALRPIARLAKLRTLRLDGTLASDAAMSCVAQCRQLEVLTLRGTDVSDDGVRLLHDLPKLRRLDLRIPPSFLRGVGPAPDPFPNTSEVSGEAVAALWQSHPQLRIRW
ncbi:MAG: hypothetical protein RIC55_05740 [Pirellulaceae bacterium]